MLADIHQDQSNRPEGKQIVHDEVPKDVRPFRTRHSMSLNHAPNLHISSIQLKRRKSQCDFRHKITKNLQNFERSKIYFSSIFTTGSSIIFSAMTSGVSSATAAFDSSGIHGLSRFFSQETVGAG